MTLDHPHIRSITTCPICGDHKERGLVTCWPCYRRHELKYGNPRCEAIIDQYETDIARAAAH